MHIVTVFNDALANVAHRIARCVGMDGSHRMTCWSSAEYERGEPTIPATAPVLFLGTSRPAVSYIQSLPTRFDEFGICVRYDLSRAAVTLERRNLVSDLDMDKLASALRSLYAPTATAPATPPARQPISEGRLLVTIAMWRVAAMAFVIEQAHAVANRRREYRRLQHEFLEARLLRVELPRFITAAAATPAGSRSTAAAA